VAAVLCIVLSLGAFGYWQGRRSSVRVVSHAPVAQPVTGDVQPAPIPVLTRSRKVDPGPIPSPNRQPLPAAQANIFQKQNSQRQISPPAVSRIAEGSNPAQTAVADPKLEEAPSLPAEPPRETKISELAFAPTAVTPPPAPQNTTPPAIVPPRADPVIPAQPKLPSTSFVAPQIIYRVNPAVPLDVRALIAVETQIDVTVKIDAAGKVTDAQVTSTRGAAARLVAAEAIKAARLFRFQPARENDRAVQSRMVLTFRFRRTGE